MSSRKVEMMMTVLVLVVLMMIKVEKYRDGLGINKDVDFVKDNHGNDVDTDDDIDELSDDDVKLK